MSWYISACPWTRNFSRGAKFESTLNAAANAGAATFVAHATTGANVALYWKRGDVVTIGPSSSVSNSGKYEQIRVLSISGTTVTLDGTLVYNYLTGDKISGVGHGMPEGATWTTATGSALTSYGINVVGSSTGGAGVEGYLNTFTGFYFGITSGAGIGSLSIQTQKRVLEGVKYRLAFHSRTISTGNSSTTVEVGATGLTVASTTISTSSSSAWAKYSTVGSAVAHANNEENLALVIKQSGTSSTRNNMVLDCCYLSHAWNCGTTAQDAGYYTIPVNPIDVSEDEIDTEDRDLNYMNRDVYRDSFESVRSISVKLKFNQASETMLKVLGMMEYWQYQDHLICLETDDFTMRPIFGYITWEPDFPNWDLTQLGCTLNIKGIQ